MIKIEILSGKKQLLEDFNNKVICHQILSSKMIIYHR